MFDPTVLKWLKLGVQFGDSMFNAINLVLNNINQKQKEAIKWTITVSFWVAKHEIQTIVCRKPPWKDGPFKEYSDVSIIFSNKSLTISCIFRVTYFFNQSTVSSRNTDNVSDL